MVIKPNGYAIWEKMQRALDGMFKDTGHSTPTSPCSSQELPRQGGRERRGVRQGVAVVTHGGGKELEEPLIIRPTSETII